MSYDDGELSHATLKKKRVKGLVGSHVKADTTLIEDTLMGRF